MDRGDIQRLYSLETGKMVIPPPFAQYAPEYVRWLEERLVSGDIDSRVEPAPTVKPMKQFVDGAYGSAGARARKLNELIAAFNAHVTGECSGETGEWCYPKDGEVIRKGDEVNCGATGKIHWERVNVGIGEPVGGTWKHGEVRRRR